VKILAIRGSNLASLAAPFALELEHGPLAQAGIFAITGPVGAGKSTLLDALCLALFDRTPRLSGQRGGVAVGDDTLPEAEWLGAGDPRTLLRREAQEGFAEADFRGRDGVRYRATWSCRRARRASARLQQQQLRLIDLDRDVVVAGGARTEVLAAIQQRLGLDFAQFCRSVLLAQGEFAAFLRAKPDERAKLLETLTGADVYRRLSRAAHARARASLHELERLRAQLDAHVPLDDAARAAVEADGERLRHQLDAARAGVILASRYVQWHDAAEQHRQREARALVELQRALDANAAAEPRRTELLRRQRALAVAPRWETARAAADAVALAADALGAAQRAHATVTATHAAAQRGFAARCERAFGAPLDDVPAIVRDLPRWAPLLMQLQRAEAAVAGAATAGLAAAADLADAQRVLDAIEPELATSAAQRDVAFAALAAASAAVRKHDGDVLAARRRDLDARRQAAAGRSAAAHAWAAAAEALARSRERAAVAAADTSARDEAAAVAGAELVGAERAADAARTRLDEARQRAGLAALRAQLRDGDACPLCGAHEHGRAHVDVDDAQLAAAAAAAGDAQRAAAAARQAATTALADARAARLARGAAERELALRAHDLEAAAGALPTVPEARPGSPAAAVASAAADAAAVEREALALARDEAAARAASAALQRAVDAADAAGRAWQAFVQQRDDARQRRDGAATAVAAARADGEREQRRAADARAALEPACEGAIGTDGVARLAGARVESLRALHGAHVELVGLAARVAGAAGAQREAETAHERATADAERARRALATALAVQQVDADDVAHAVSLGADALAATALALQQLATAVETARAVVRERAEQRREHEHHERPSLDAADAAAALADARRAADVVEQRLFARRSELVADDRVRRHRAELEPRLEAATAAQQSWLALDELIGSSSGDAFAVFAQELTLDLLLVEANRRLGELARRYRLRRNPAGPLDFVVVDLDLGATTRSVWTLSGGETFLVSLALALALATLAAPRARVETLFLDEGFGTLDAASLEQALGALDSLQATGCQVGVISHVDGIAERIGAEVAVQPVGGGQSRVTAVAR
jgi:exonuclease SbcC